MANTTEQKPLLGLRVLNTRALEDNEELDRRLRQLGAQPISLPATRIGPPEDPGPLDDAIASIVTGLPAAPAFDWIAFTSAHAASAFMDRLLGSPDAAPPEVSGRDTRNRNRAAGAEMLAGIRLAAVGPATESALQEHGLTVDLVPDRAAGRHLAAAFGEVSALRILLPRSSLALRDLPDALRARGAVVTEVVAYASQPAPADPRILRRVLAGELDAATFFSPSAVDGLAAQVAPRLLDDTLKGTVVACVGETTAQAARGKGVTQVVVAGEASVAGIIRALIEWRRHHEDGGVPPARP